MLLAQIEAEKKQAIDKANALFAQAEDEKRELTPEERAKVEEHLATADELNARLQGAKQDTSLKDRLSAYRTAKAPEGHATEKVIEAGKRQAAMTFGQLVIASAIGDFIKANGHRARQWASPVVELTAETLTTGTSPESGGALITPDYRPGIWPILAQVPTVRALLASGTTDSNAIVYFVETLATNAAAGVEELGDKPEAALRFAQRTDNVKKVATWLPASTEMLEDFAQIRSYIDGRLRLFIQEEVDDQLLNGDGLDGDIEGIRNRSNLTPLHTPAGGTNVMDAIHQQITEIMINSLVMPTGIVMHPRDWQTAVLSKSSTAGEYFGNNPFAAQQSRNMWGLPVTITTRMTQGRALIGAFGTMAQVFGKGGITVDMTNSHDDFFTKNKVAIRAEERLALAVYRPGAFGEVVVGTGESESES